MSAFLGRLIDRALGRAPVLEPLRPSRFAPVGGVAPAHVTSLLAGVDRALDEPREAEARPSRAPARSEDRLAEVSRHGGASAAPASLAPMHPERRAAAAEERAANPTLATADRAIVPAMPAPSPGAPEARNAPPAVADAPSGGRRDEERPERHRQRDEDVAPRERRASEEPRPPPLRAPEALSRAPSPLPVPPLLVAAPETSRRGASRQPSSAESAPEIHVTIGRIEVRATPPSSPAPRAADRRRASPVSLDDYLQRRDRTGR
jgi:hypothetical protein